MKHKFKFLTLSRVFNDCRDTVGRLSTLFLLLFALSFGFNQEAWAKTVYIDVSWNTNYADKMLVHFWGGTNDKFVWASKSSDTWNYMYQATIDDDAKYWQVCRGDGTGSSDSKYNYQSNVTLPNNKYKVKGWDNNGEASKIIGLVTGGYLYFDNSCGLLTSSKHQFAIGNSTTKLYELTNISGTNLYYTTPTDTWPDATYYAVMSNSSLWNGGTWGYSNINNSATKATAEYNGPYDLNSGNTYVITANGSSKGSTMSITWKNGYDGIDKYTHTLNVYTRTSVDGVAGDYDKTSKNSPTSVTLTGKKLNGNGTATNATATVNTSAKTASVSDVVMTSTLTGSYTALAQSSAWVFDGWSESSDGTNLSNTYSKSNVKAATTVNAFFTLRKYTVTFAAKGEGIDKNTVTAKINSSAITSGNSYDYGSKVIFTATPYAGYQIEGWYSDADCTQSLNNGTNTTYTINSLTATTSVYVKFKTQEYSVTFGVGTDCTSLGSVKASVNDGAAQDPGTYSIGASSKIVFTASPITGYHVAGWYSDAACTQAISGANTSYTIASLAKTETVYVKFAANTYTVVFNGNGKTGGTMSNQAHTYDAAQNLTTNTFVKSGYTFQGWDTNSAGTTVVYTDGQSVFNLTTTNNATINLYAVWQINTYNITYPASPAHYTITENTTSGDYNTSASFKATPEDGYRLVVTATKAGGGSVSLSQDNYSYSFTIPAADVTINVAAYPYRMSQPNPGSQSNTLVDFTDGVYQVSLNKNTWYTFRIYNEGYTEKADHYMGSQDSWNVEENLVDGKVTMHANAAAFWLCTGVAGTYTFTLKNSDDNKPVLSITYPNVSTITIKHASKADDVLTFTQVGSSNIWRSNVVALEQNKTYNTEFYWEGSFRGNTGTMTYDNHTGWHMQHYNALGQDKFINMQIQTRDKSHNAGNYYFEFNTENHYLTAVYPSYFRSNGDGIGWDNSHPLTFDENGIAVFEFEATRAYKDKGILEVKVVDEGQYYTLDKTITTSASNEQFIADPQENTASFKVQIVEEMLGTYTFTYNKKTHQMSVGYPDTEQFDITYTDAEGTKTIKAGPNGGRGISAANKPGYRFTGWVIGPVDDHSYITVAGNDNSRQTTTVYGHKAGGSITATYSNDEFIYFKNNPGWSSVSVYFYNGDYFNETSGTGCVAKWKENNQDKEDRKAQGYAMTRIPNSDIWYLDYKNVAWKPGTSTIVAFADAYQNNAQWFDQCQVAYRKDFNTCMPLFSPVNYIHRYLNKHDNQQTCYYDQGHWMKYDSQESGYTLRIYSGYESATEKTSVAMVADYAGGYSFRGSVILPVGDDQPGHVYGFKLNGCNGSYFGNNGEMNSGNCSNWEFNPSSEMHNCGLKTTSKGEYIFTMSFSGGVMHVSVEYPLSDNDYRVVYSDNQGELWNGLYYKNSTEDKLDTASFYIKNGAAGAVVKLQKCTDASTSPVTWGEVQSIDVSSYETGVYNFKIAQTSSTATLSKIGAYTGNYYIRSKALDGGLEGYEANADNRMNYTTANPAFAADNQQGYNYYKTRWITIGKDVSYTVANDYSKNISATMTGDEIIGDDTQTLPADANVRFTWNSNTNALSRAYIKGSSNAGDKFVQVYGENIYSDLECTTELTPENPGLFKDNQDWVYEYTMYATSGATATVKTDYNKQEQLLISNQAVFSSTKGGDVAKLRALYDFKTNRFVAAWTPNGQIDAEYSISADIMLMRNGQQQADQMTFSGEGSITGEPKTVYGAVKFDKSLMELKGAYQTYDRSIFWISFPFDVRLNDVFGLGQYGKYWIIRYYDGAERARKGWFQETKTFWKTVSVEEREHGGTDGKGFILKANEGYNLVLDYTAVLKDLYPNGATENYLFFPSKDKISSISSSLQENEITYNPLTCTITSPEDRTNEDSNWRVIGVPSYANAGELTSTEGIKFYYAWNRDNNTLGVDKVGFDVGTFQSMHAYMVQFAGTIDWKNMSITTTPATAPLFANNEKEEYSLRLELQQEGKKVDQAYVDLTDEATEEFDLNLDITKLMYSTSQIYSFIGNDKVAANSLPVRDVVVPLCVTAAANGTYTIALPDGTEGLNVTLYDVTAGKETNMSFDGYTVHLDKGEYNNRFLLNISVPRVPTNMRNANGEWSVDGKTKKLFINDNIYLINAGRIYNVLGVGE